MTQRVTDEQARHIAGCDPTVYVQPGLGPGVTTSDLAADLLDTRTEIASLRAFVGNNMLRSDYQTVDHMRAEIAALRSKLAAVCEAGEKRVSGSEHDALCPGNRLRKDPCTCGYEALDDAIVAAREGKP